MAAATSTAVSKALTAHPPFGLPDVVVPGDPVRELPLRFVQA
jgi:hypothetical protein